MSLIGSLTTRGTFVSQDPVTPKLDKQAKVDTGETKPTQSPIKPQGATDTTDATPSKPVSKDKPVDGPAPQGPVIDPFAALAIANSTLPQLTKTATFNTGDPAKTLDQHATIETTTDLNSLGKQLGATGVTVTQVPTSKSDTTSVGTAGIVAPVAEKAGDASKQQSSADTSKDSNSNSNNFAAALATAQTPKAAAQVSASTPTQPLNQSERVQAVQQVTDHIQLQAATKPQQAVTIHLQPPHLGEVVVALKNVHSALEAHITASDSRLKTALDDSRADLSARLKASGISVGEIKVDNTAKTATDSQSSFGSSSQPGFSQANQFGGQQAGGVNSAPRFSNSKDDDASIAIAVPSTTGSSTGLDLLT